MKTKEIIVVLSLILITNINIAQTTYSYATVEDEFTDVAITTEPTDENICLGNSVTLSAAATGTMSLLYQWKKGGADISGANASTYTIDALSLSDEAIYTCEISNICNTLTSEQAELKVVELTVNAGLDETICEDANVQLNAVLTTNYPSISQPYSSINWSPATSLSNATIVNPVAQPTSETNYTVIVTDAIGCTATSNVTVSLQYVYQNQQLCFVSVDPTTEKNKIVWEANENVGIDSYVIQKELSINNYTPIDTVDANDTPEFIDLDSDPVAHSDFYKITVQDTCGHSSDINNSVYHKTIYLSLSNVGSTVLLNWEQYEVEDGSYEPANYKIYRGTETTSMVEIDEINGMLSSYNDSNIYEVYYYMVGAVRSDCGSGGKSINTSYTIFSNKKDNTGLVTELIENSAYLPVTIYPNPATNNVQIKGLKLKGESNLTITDVFGKQVMQLIIRNSELEIQVEDLASGTYFITIKGDNLYRGKFVKE